MLRDNLGALQTPKPPSDLPEPRYITTSYVNTGFWLHKCSISSNPVAPFQSVTKRRWPPKAGLTTGQGRALPSPCPLGKGLSPLVPSGKERSPSCPLTTPEPLLLSRSVLSHVPSTMLISLSHSPRGGDSDYPPVAHGETEAQRGHVCSARGHRAASGEGELGPGLSDSRAQGWSSTIGLVLAEAVGSGSEEQKEVNALSSPLGPQGRPEGECVACWGCEELGWTGSSGGG